MSPREAAEKAVAAFNTHHAANVAGHFAPDATVTDPFYPEPMAGRAAIEKDYADFFRAFPDARNTLRAIIADGDTVAGEIELNATHSGPLSSPDGDIPPTGRAIHVRGGFFSRIDSEGQILEERRYYDAGGLIQQIL